MVFDLCPCGSQKVYEVCCGRYHQGIHPEDALALMRSRYSAYAKHLATYIIKTTHPANPRTLSDEFAWATEILAFTANTHFDELVIHDFRDGEKVAYVKFTAHLRQGGGDASFTEESRFEKVSGWWFYHSGVVT